VHLLLVGKMLSGREGKSRSNDTLDSRVIGVVHEEAHTVHRSIDLEILLEETSCLKVDTHCGEDNDEVLLACIMNVLSLTGLSVIKMRSSGLRHFLLANRLRNERCLTTDLRTNLRVRKTGGREKRNLLTSGNRGHGVNSRDTRLDHFSRVLSHVGVDRLTLIVEVNKVSVIVYRVI
jgi:hypothetical protein